MKTNSVRQRLLASTMIFGAATLSIGLSGGQAFAQSTSATPAVGPQAPATGPIESNAAASEANTAQSGGSTVQEVVVTGSRIPSPTLTSVSPVTSVGQQEFQREGRPSIEEALRQLPSTLGDGDNSTTNNASTGIATVDLRGLGDNRTLVLVDGKRLVASNATNEVDLNTLPSEMIDHIEVLTGGASSTYGGDAVSGVVNLILRKNFQGIEADANLRDTGKGDGLTQKYTAIIGVSSGDNKGNLTAYGSYIVQDAVSQGARDFSQFALTSPDFSGCFGNISYKGLCQGGSGTIPEGRVSSIGDMFTNERTLVPYDGHEYNYNPLNYLQTANTHRNFGAVGHYEVNPHLDFYTRLTFADTQSQEQLAPTPISEPLTVNYGNPFLSTQEQTALFGAGTFAPTDTTGFILRLRNTQGGNRIELNDHTSYQAVLGAKGNIAGSWNYDVSVQYGAVHYQERLENDVNLLNFQNGLLVNSDGTCISGGSCVPIDIFSTNSISTAAKNYYGLNLDAFGTTSQADVQASIEGNIGLTSPVAATPISVAFGTEYRREASNFLPDDNLATGNDPGFGASPPVSGNFNVAEVFGEARIPLVEDKPFVKLLQFEGGYRFSDYNLSGSVESYKAAGEWEPVRGFRFRASYDRAVREPDVEELFSPAAQSADTGVDPCGTSNGAPATASAALCEATGVPAKYYNTATLDCQGQCNTEHTGNSSLKPEVADTKSIGLVFNPSQIKGLTGSVDYYNIKINGAINIVPLTQVLSYCYGTTTNPTQSANNQYCQLLHRDQFGSFTTTSGYANLIQSNIGLLRNEGIDFELNYRRRLSDFGLSDAFGTLEADLTGTYQIASDIQNSTTVAVDHCVGLFGDICGAPSARWRSNTRLTWISDRNIGSLSLRWRYIGSVRFDETVINGLDDPYDHRIPTFSYFDLTGTLRLWDTVSVIAGVNNLLNKSPPLIDSELATANLDSGNTFPGTYDVLGRVFFLNVSKAF